MKAAPASRALYKAGHKVIKLGFSFKSYLHSGLEIKMVDVF